LLGFIELVAQQQKCGASYLHSPNPFRGQVFCNGSQKRSVNGSSRTLI
jgi:hypothetical protein